MGAESENTWNWYQASGNKLKVISNAKKGTIRVYNENGEIILEKTNLTKDQIKIIEHNFLCHVTKKSIPFSKNVKNQFDPMVA